MTQATAVRSLPTVGRWDVGEFEALHSSVSFEVIHSAVTTFRSGFAGFEASFDATARKFTGTVKVETLQCFDLLRKRLFEEDFFDAGNHPNIKFESTSIEEQGNRLVVAGNLTMKGVTKPVRAEGRTHGTAQVFHPWSKTIHEHMGVDLRLTIDRGDFGVSFNNELPDGRKNLGYTVVINLALDFACAEPVQEPEASDA